MTSQDTDSNPETNELRDKSSVFNVTKGSLYLNCVDITNFHYTSATGYATISFPPGDNERHLDMANSSLSNVSTKTETAGILCRVFKDDTTSEQLNAKKTTLFIHKSTFTDCASNATSNNSYAGGAAIRSYAADRSTLQVKDCIFTKNKITAPSTDKTTGGGAICWKSALASATLISCTFTENHCDNVGGAVFNAGRMTIQGCTFTNNTAKSGGAIAVEPPNTSKAYPIPTNELNGSLTLDENTIISGNTATQNGGGIYFNAATKQIGPSNPITNFDMRLTLNGTKITGNHAANGGGIAMHLNYGENTYSNKITINEGTQITGNTATGNGGSIWMNSESTCDCKNSEGILMLGGTLQGNSASTGGAIYIHKGKDTQNNINFQLEGGNVLGNTATSNGGVAYIDGGNFTMTGGTLGNKDALNTAANGGGVYVNGGSVTVSGTSVIAGNKATADGGAAYIKGGNFIMTGGSLGQEGNPNIAVNGGGVYVNGGSASVTGGNVQSNTAANGAGIYVNNGSASVTGGQVQKNTATESGGGIYVTDGNFTLNGPQAQINENTAANGAGVYLTGGTPALFYGTLSGNIAAENGGGIFIDEQKVVLTPTNTVLFSGNKAADGAGMYISGAAGDPAGFSVSTSAGSVIFAENIATGNGGGVCLSYGDMSITNEQILLYGNQAANGGGAAVLNGSFTLTGGSIGASDKAVNQATNGGGVYVAGGNVTVSDTGTITNNQAANGGGVYLTGGEFTMNGANTLIHKNTATMAAAYI